MIYIVIILSFILDSIISNFISVNSLFYPLCTIMSLIIIYPYINKNMEKYLKICFLTGLAYDLIYTDSIFIHAIIFLLLGVIIAKLSGLLASNIVNNLIISTTIIIIYRLIFYLLLLIMGDVHFNFLNLFRSIYSSLIINYIYISLLLFITDNISYKFKIRKTM